MYDRSAPSDLGSTESSNSHNFLKFLRSVAKSSLSPALWTLTATFWPFFFRVPRWTWPSDAAAIGSLLKSLKTSSTEDTPSSFATMDAARSPEKAGTSSCSDLSTSMYSAGRTSVLVDKTCPSLTNVGPNVNNRSRAKVAAAVLSSEDPFLAFSTLNAHRASAFHTSKFLLREPRPPRFSQPFSSISPSIMSAAVADLPVGPLTDDLMSRLSSPLVSSFFSSSKHSGSGSMTSHSSSTNSVTAFSIAGVTTNLSTSASTASATLASRSSVAAWSFVAVRPGRMGL
mmetsp:Transcript_2324/g.6529  ORF Transcript_2324/g.6529 Transcript_2324/m.6529 type:complete len:285 (-) Transcript_2324:197-1051(-)